MFMYRVACLLLLLNGSCPRGPLSLLILGQGRRCTPYTEKGDSKHVMETWAPDMGVRVPLDLVVAVPCGLLVGLGHGDGGGGVSVSA